MDFVFLLLLVLGENFLKKDGQQGLDMVQVLKGEKKGVN